jgi:hypothetical protein
MATDTAKKQRDIAVAPKHSGHRKSPTNFTGDFESIVDVFNGDIDAADRARLAVSLTSAKDRAELAGQIAERLVAQQDVLKKRKEFKKFFDVGAEEEILPHVRDQIEEKISQQVMDPSARAALSEALAQAIAGDEAALAQIQQRYPEFTWDPKQGDAVLRESLQRQIEGDLTLQAEELKKMIELEADVLAEKGKVAERIEKRGGLWNWAKDKVRALWAKRSVRVATYITVGVAASVLIAWGAYNLLAYLQAMHAGALTTAGEAAGAAAQGGGALAPAAGLEGAGSAVTGGAGGAPILENIWIGEELTW